MQPADMMTDDLPPNRFSRREQLTEVLVFLFLIGPSLIYSFISDALGNVGFVETAVATILRDLSLLALILFFLWRNLEKVKCLGWSFRNVWKDVSLGVVLFIPTFIGARYLEQFLISIGFTIPSVPTPSLEPSRTTYEMAWAVVLVIVVAIAEESIFRGYLMLRFEVILKSRWWSLLISAFIFSLGHGYEGTAGVITVGALGLVFGLIYLWRKSLTAPITMHFLQDFIGIVLLPLLGY